jgi:hypothetical protein
MTVEDLDHIMARVTPEPDGSWRAIASKFLPGKPVGPFNWKGKRGDDPFDTVRHDNRRELRGLRVIAAWLDHFDTKQLNTLDMYVEEHGKHHLRHNLIDFASTLGASATGPFPLANYEYVFDAPASLGRAASLSFIVSWERIQRPAGLDGVGYLESKGFNPTSEAARSKRDLREPDRPRRILGGENRIRVHGRGHRRRGGRGTLQEPDASSYVARMLGSAATRSRAAGLTGSPRSTFSPWGRNAPAPRSGPRTERLPGSRLALPVPHRRRPRRRAGGSWSHGRRPQSRRSISRAPRAGPDSRDAASGGRSSPSKRR